MGIKLIALDIDGTLTGNLESTVSKRNLEAITEAQRQGVFVTIATGRASFSTRPFWKLLHIEGPSIQYGGAWTVDTVTEELLDSKSLDPLVVRDVMRFAREMGVSAQLYVGNTIYVGEENPFTSAYVKKNGMPVVVDPDICERLYENVPKLLAFSEAENEPAMRARFEERFAGKAHITRSQSTFIEINDFAATKGGALSRLAEKMGIQREEVAALGDSYLDQDMIEWAGTGVCVENGAQEVKDASDVIAPACADDGVAWYIEHYVLQ